jgi:hypothetical protein
MNLLDTASLVVTPNGYKASKLYSIVPSDGTGDMTFARTGDTATRVNASGLIESVTANKPRLDYLGSTCPKLLLEPQRTNLLNYSDAFDNAQWTKGELTVTANSTASPDGTTNADSLTETAANDYHITYQAKSLTTATTYTFSVFVKPNGRNFARMLFGNGPFPDNQYVYFNLVTDEIVKTASVTAKIETYANGWKRCIATCTADASSSDAVYFGPARNTTDGYVTYAGNASLGIFAYGAQLEAGAYATSYIPTTTASVTRNADSCSKTNATILPTSYPFTLFAHGYLKQNFDALITLTDITSDEIYYLIGSTDNGFVATSRNVTINNASTSSGRSEGYHKVAAVFTSTSIKLFANGQLIATATNSISFNVNVNDVLLGQLRVVSDIGQRSNLYSAAIFNTAKTDQECITLTSI